MRAVVQRVSSAAVAVAGAEIARIGRGFLVLAGAARGDGEADARWLAGKVAGLRLFDDAAGKMNLGLAEVGGAVLVVSQFTLLADCRQGRRPSFTGALGGAEAEKLVDLFAALLRQAGRPVAAGRFGARMEVSLVNDGPVTVLLDSREPFPE